MARRRESLDRDWQHAATATGLLSLLFPDHRTPETPGVRRKLRLVLCGAARTVWDRLPHDDLRAAVEVAERFADSRASGIQLQEVRRVVTRRQFGSDTDRGRLILSLPRDPDDVPADHREALASAEYAHAACELVLACCNRSVTVARTAGRILADFPRLAAPPSVWDTAALFSWDDGELQVGPDPAAGVVRDLFGGPTPVRFPEAWRTPTVRDIAAGIALDAGFARLPVLADALEDAGCDDDRVLSHCRGPGPHWRGCWVVDGVMGSQPDARARAGGGL